MSFEEIEHQWKTQPRREMSEREAQEWVRKVNRSEWVKWVALWAGLLTAVVHAPLRLTLLWNSEKLHLVNWVFECLFLGVPIIACLITMIGLRRRDQSRKACHMHVIRLLELMVSTTNQEIKEIRYHSPAIMSGFLLLVGVSRWSAYVTGYESAQKSMVLFGLISGIILICGAVLYHRLSAFLLPRRDYLTRLIHELRQNG